MKKKFSKFCLFVFTLNYFFMFIPDGAFALTSNEIQSRAVCNETFEVAYANADGSLTNKACLNTYNEAKNLMNTTVDTNHENLVILEKKEQNYIIDAKYAMVDLNKGDKGKNTNIFLNSSGGSAYTYINGHPSYGGIDAPFLGIDYSSKRIAIKIGGIKGWINEVDDGLRNYRLVPLIWVNSTARYIITDSTISLMTTSNIYATSYNNTLTFGKKPTMLNKGTYYSYDTNYFYNSLYTMIDDYKNNIYSNAVNKDNPYYNYYMYLPNHTKTTYSGLDIDIFLKNAYNSYSYTMLYSSGYAFYHAQELYGSNALLMLSVARNESGEGKSNISTGRYNIFGHDAYDSDPSGSASGYATIRASIDAHAYRFLTYRYSFPSDWRFYGSQLGDKKMGANVKYASDPYWGLKAARNYYNFDYSGGFEDYNYYQLAIKSKDGVVEPRMLPYMNDAYKISTVESSSREPYYNYGRNGSSVVIVEEVKGDIVNGSDVWYKIMSDVNIDKNGKYINYVNGMTPPSYDWDVNYVYVPASYYTKINDTTIKDPNTVTNYVEKDNKYETYMKNGVLTPRVAIVNASSNLYLDANLTVESKTTLPNNRHVLVFEKMVDKDNNLKSYYVSSNYDKGFKEWIEASRLTFTTKSYGKMVIKSGEWANVRSGVNGSIIGKMAQGSFMVIHSSQVVNGVEWLEIEFDGRRGYIIALDNEQEVIKTMVTNYPPVIEATNQTIGLGNSFDPLKYATASDLENGNLTSKITVKSNNVDVNKIGVYTVVYQVVDNDGLSSEKSITVNIVEHTVKSGLFDYQGFKHINNDVFEAYGFLGIKGMDNAQGTGIKHKIIFKNDLTNEEFSYDLANLASGYPFEMSDIDDDKEYNYNGGWFKGSIDLKDLKEGDYTIYVEVYNSLYKSRVVFQNLVYKEMTRKATGTNSRGYLIEMNYFSKERPMQIFIRNEGLLGNSIPPTSDKMFNFFENINFANNLLKIRGTSHNVNIDYSNSKIVTREIILENTTTFKRYRNEVGAITDGDYVVDLKVSDGKDKTKAWYDGGIDISNLEKGVYAIYVMTTVDGFSDYGELRDLSYITFNQKVTVNGKNYSLRRVDEKRFRVELVVE